MISVFGAPIIAGHLVLIALWVNLTRRNILNDNIGYACGCACLTTSFFIGVYQYFTAFYINKTIQLDNVMWPLFIKILSYVAGTLIFTYCYKPIKKDL